MTPGPGRSGYPRPPPSRAYIVILQSGGNVAAGLLSRVLRRKSRVRLGLNVVCAKT